MPRLWLAMFALLCVIGEGHADNLLHLEQSGLGIPWGSSAIEVATKYPQFVAASGPSTSYKYRGTLGLGDATARDYLVFLRFDRTGALTQLNVFLEREDIVGTIRYLQTRLGQGRTASYPDSNLFQRFYEWTGRDFSIELSYEATTNDPLSAPLKGDRGGRVAIKRALSQPSEVDRALAYPQLVENVKQQMKAAEAKQAQERSARDALKAAPKEPRR